MKMSRLGLYSIISLTISVGLILLIKKMDAKKVTKPTMSDSYDKVVDNDLIIIKPSGKNNFDVLIVFGGMSYANPSWMLSQIPQNILKSYLIIISPYTKSYSKVYSYLQGYLSENNFKMSSLSIVGFSAGGNNAQSAYSPKLKHFGLIDPSTKSIYENIDYGKNTYMVYNNSNWGVYPNIKSLQVKMAKNIKSSGGIVEETKLSHNKIPKYFFDNYLM